MSIAGTIDAPLDLFGGLVTDMAAADLPQGVSPDCQDVAFLQGAVKTRPGLLSVYSPIAGNPTVNYLKTYTQPNLVKTLLAIDSAGTLWGENSPGVLTQIAAGLTPNAAASSTSLFGREYIAQHDGNFGLDMPRQYDGTTFDRVSQIGPGAGSAAVADIVANISAISRTSNIVTVTTAAPTGLLADRSGDHRGRHGHELTTEHFRSRRSSIRCTSLTRKQMPTRLRAAARPLPSARISAGVHQCAVIFVTRQGYLTRPSPPISWTASGGMRANVTGIPSVATLPNIVARILAFTGAGGDLFYYTTGLDGAPQMQVFDNQRLFVCRGFFGHGAAGGNCSGFAVSTGGARRMRRRDRLRGAAVLVGRAQQAKQLGQSHV